MLIVRSYLLPGEGTECKGLDRCIVVVIACYSSLPRKFISVDHAPCPVGRGLARQLEPRGVCQK